MGMVLHEVADPLKTLHESRRISRLAVAVLEWPYKRQPDTPLKVHRLKADEIRQLSVQAGFKNIQTLPLTNMILYLMDI